MITVMHFSECNHHLPSSYNNIFIILPNIYILFFVFFDLLPSSILNKTTQIIKIGTIQKGSERAKSKER